MTLFSLTLILFLIMDPIGNISSYLKMVDGIERKNQNRIVFREMLIALFVMVLFNFIGEYIFNIFQISETTVRISSGLIMFLIALQILFPYLNGLRSNISKEEPFIVPLAVPLIAGPSLCATIMLFAHIEPSVTLMLKAIFLAWLASVIVLLFANNLQRILGKNGLLACERLMGMILILLAIQRFLDGIQLFVLDYAAKL